jgi:hypothetical protein
MKYFLKRGEEKYGPYSLAELQKYVQTGNIAMTDVAQSEGMTEWAPISQVIGNVQVPVTAAPAGTVYGGPGSPSPAVEQVPLPPNLHWALVLVINLSGSFIPFSFLFNMVWSLVLANWARKLDGDNNTLVFVAMYPAGIIAGVLAEVVAGFAGNEFGRGIGVVLLLGGVIFYLVGIFKIKAAMESYYTFNENIGLSLSGVMTFFFSTVYLQFHVNRIARWKKTGVLN